MPWGRRARPPPRAPLTRAAPKCSFQLQLLDIPLSNQCRIWYRRHGIESRSTNQNCPFRKPTDRLDECPTGSRSLGKQTLGFDEMSVACEACTVFNNSRMNCTDVRPCLGHRRGHFLGHRRHRGREVRGRLVAGPGTGAMAVCS